MQIDNVFHFNKALELGPYAWPGGYPLYFICADGEPIEFNAAKENAGFHREEIINGDDNRIIAVDTNWEDSELYCCQTGRRIESAYGDA